MFPYACVVEPRADDVNGIYLVSFRAWRRRRRAGDASSATRTGLSVLLLCRPLLRLPLSLAQCRRRRRRRRARCFRARLAARFRGAAVVVVVIHGRARARARTSRARCSSCEGRNSCGVLSRLQTAATSIARMQVRIVCVPFAQRRRLRVCVVPLPLLPSLPAISSSPLCSYGRGSDDSPPRQLGSGTYALPSLCALLGQV